MVRRTSTMPGRIRMYSFPRRPHDSVSGLPVWCRALKRKRSRKDIHEPSENKHDERGGYRVRVRLEQQNDPFTSPEPRLPQWPAQKRSGGYIYGLYKRERVLAIAQSKEGRDAKRAMG